MESFEDKLNGTVPPLVIGICILLILLGIGKLTDYLDDRKQEQCDELRLSEKFNLQNQNGMNPSNARNIQLEKHGI